MNDLHDVADELARVRDLNYVKHLESIGAIAMKFIDARTPYKTGQLLQGNRFNVVNEAAIEFGNDAPYAIFVLNGTKPHQIRPKNAGGVLAFDIGGQTIFTTLVNHPGTTANPFIENGLSDATAAMEAEGVRFLSSMQG